MFGLLILSLCLLVTVSPSSAGIYNTYVKMDSYTVHHGENVTVKVELFSDGGGWFGSDGWVDHAKLLIDVLAKDKNDHVITVMRERIYTNLWANAYYTIDTSGMEPGYYELEVYFPRTFTSHGNVYLSSEGSAGLLVT